MAINPIGRNFWEEQHKKGSQEWLTASSLGGILRWMELESDPVKDRKVLEIGVGLGLCTKELSSLTKTLYCADISQTALDRVAPFASATYLTQDLKKIPPVDFAMCHLVLVHCTDEETTRIINDVNLSPDGIMAFQISKLKDDHVTERIQKEVIDQGTHFFRSIEQTIDIIRQTNKEIVNITKPRYPGFWLGDWMTQEWFYVIVKNK